MHNVKLKLYNYFILLFFVTLGVTAQSKKQDTLLIKKDVPFNYKALVIPALLISYGAIGMDHEDLLDFDLALSNSVNDDYNRTFHIDEVTQSLAFASVYGLNLFGIKGKNNFKDRTIILGTAYLLMGSSVTILKNSIERQRPNQTGYTSFPSGHTATAFMGAEFLYQEYKNVSIWYGISGYLVAAGTGYLRMYNNKHWFTDIATGAGIGILSTKIAYWVQPLFKNLFSKKEETIRGTVIPFYNGQDLGLGMSLSF